MQRTPSNVVASSSEDRVLFQSQPPHYIMRHRRVQQQEAQISTTNRTMLTLRSFELQFIVISLYLPKCIQPPNLNCIASVTEINEVDHQNDLRRSRGHRE